jgi:hypothetical protein
MYKKYLYMTTVVLNLAGLSTPFIHASSIKEENSESIACTIQTQDTEHQPIPEQTQETCQTLTACKKEIVLPADKDKVYDIENPLLPREINKENMGSLAELPDELLVKVLSFKGISKAARGVCYYMERLCLDPSAELQIKLNTSTDFDIIFNNQTSTIPNSYANIKLEFTPTDFYLGLIGKLPSLRKLNLSGTQVSNLSPLSGLTALRHLNLSRTKVRDISPLSGLTALQYLWLNHIKVSDLRPLAGLTALQHLELRKTHVRDVSPLSGLTALQVLWVNFAPVSDISPLSGLTALQYLWLNTTPVSDLRPLAGLTALQYLCLNATPVSDISPLTGLPALRYLDLSFTQVSDMSPLAGNTSITILRYLE